MDQRREWRGHPIETMDGAPNCDNSEVDDKGLRQRRLSATAAIATTMPKYLLDFPVEILKEVIQQLPHTNDLTSLALCNSKLHGLTIPYLYSRFDIVWPDSANLSSNRTGVDALTYGLATLVMAQELFTRPRRRTPECRYRPKRYGNEYAQHVKKFSLSNGPPDLVKDYVIFREEGKMLGTLVAMATARMRSLESLVWDMPTGILRDVWLALSSLAEGDDDSPCRLEKVWVRWHNNSELTGITTAPMHAVVSPANVNSSLSSNNAWTAATPTPLPQPAGHATSRPFSTVNPVVRIEHPTFSVVPPLKSLTVLDIDELNYLDEMSVLIERSVTRLRELRVGLAPLALLKTWVHVYHNVEYDQVDMGASSTKHSSIGNNRLGGVLGVLVGRVFNLKRSQGLPSDALPTSKRIITGHGKQIGEVGTFNSSENSMPTTKAVIDGPTSMIPSKSKGAASETPEGPRSTELEQAVETQLRIDDEAASHQQAKDIAQRIDGEADHSSIPSAGNAESGLYKNAPQYDRKICLETLELERVPLSIYILHNAFDWSHLMSLTLLSCGDLERLWKSLRQRFNPRGPVKAANNDRKMQPKDWKSSPCTLEYRLNIKKLHTNSVSPALMSLIKETLAPNSLEGLFLLDNRDYPLFPGVTIDKIFGSAISRHRLSLKKLYISSNGRAGYGNHNSNNKWRRWMLTREMVRYITSPKMVNLRELGVALDYRDWHLFLQRLPGIPHVRSLYITHLSDQFRSHKVEAKELALQVLDMVDLQPKIELCYLGVFNTCFEILEDKSTGSDRGDDIANGYASNQASTANYGTTANLSTYQAGDSLSFSDEEDEDEDDDENEDENEGVDEDEDEDDEDEYDELNNDYSMDGVDENSSDSDDDTFQDNSEDDTCSKTAESGKPRFRIREILFYDDKVAIFKARHGRL